jgi:hypothetical protein
MLYVCGQSRWRKNQRQMTCKTVYTEGEQACLSPLAFPCWLDPLIGGMLDTDSNDRLHLFKRSIAIELALKRADSNLLIV